MVATVLRFLCLTAFFVVSTARATLAGELVVSGAASLSGAMTEIKTAFEAAHPEWQIFVNFAASGQLLQQIEAGAPVDVFAPADQETMDRAQKIGLIDAGSRANFTANDLMLVVPSDSSLVSCPKDMTDAKVGRIALGEPDAVPAGSYTKAALVALGLWEGLEPKLVYGLSVKQALDYVALGEVDAAFVYATDARLAHERVRVVANMAGHMPIIYPAAVVAASSHKDAAREFVAFLCGEPGQTILAHYGFKKAP
jgi:molybdate transport system substrate-binding protein